MKPGRPSAARELQTFGCVIETRPGPQPENQRKRRELRGARHALVSVLVVVAALAVVRMLPHVAVGLLMCLAASQVVAAVVIATDQPRARTIALAVALFAVVWGVWHVLVQNEVTWFQVVLLGGGSLEALLVAGSTPRKAGEASNDRWRLRR